jgi:hypothetical protein
LSLSSSWFSSVSRRGCLPGNSCSCR